MAISASLQLFTKNLVKTIASGEVIRRSEKDKSTRLVIRGYNNEAVLFKSKAGNGWVVTGFKLKEQVNQSRGATASDLRSNESIRSRFNEVAVLNQLSNIARQFVNNDIMFNRNNEFGTIKNTNEIEDVADDEAIRRINTLQEAVRRHVGSRPARSSKSVSIN